MQAINGRWTAHKNASLLQNEKILLYCGNLCPMRRAAVLSGGYSKAVACGGSHLCSLPKATLILLSMKENEVSDKSFYSI